jgi:lysine/ornithine N-monooxygenase
VYWKICLLSATGAYTWLAVQLSFVYVELQQRHKAHCLAFPVLGLVSYRMTVITERLLGPLSYRAGVTPGAIDACLASQSPRFLEGSLPIL